MQRTTTIREHRIMRCFLLALALMFDICVTASAAEIPKRGGILTFMIPADAPPSLDGHREATFAMVHAVAPFYSVLMRVDPSNPADTTHFVCDLCLEIPQPTDGGKTYTFKIRPDAKFPDGTP